MKLISCYVEQYGALAAREYHFDGGLTVFCEENGMGKTTLASFIKAMFYGLEPYRTNSKEFCDRMHFYPFAGGSFGGNLTFEWEGDTYKIERFFGEKSDLNDTLAVYCNGALTDRFGTDIGKQVFGIDKASFERTLFVDSEEIECAATADIGVRLNRFVQGVDEEMDLDRAITALDSAASELKKKRGKESRIAREREAIAALEDKIRNATRIGAGLSPKYEAYNANEARIATLTGELTAAQTKNAVLADFEHYEYLLGTVTESKEKLAALYGQYPKGLPTDEEAATYKALIDKREKVLALAERKTFDAEDEASLARLSALFSDGMPDEEELADASQRIARVSEVAAALAAAEQRVPDEREGALLARFSGREVSDAQLAELGESVSAVTRAKNAYLAAPATLMQVASAPKQSMRKYAVLAVLAVVIAAIGGVLLLQSTLLGGILLALGGVLLLGDAFFYLNRKSALGASAQSELRENPKKRILELEWRTAQQAVVAALERYGYTVAEDVEATFFRFSEDLSRYRTSFAREAARHAEIAELSAQRSALVAALDDFFARFSLTEGTYIDAMATLRADIQEYRKQSGRKKLDEREQKRNREELSELNERIAAFCAAYEREALDVQLLFADKQTERTLLAAIDEGEKKAEAHRAAKQLGEKPEGGATDIAALNEQLRELRDLNARALREIESDEREAEMAALYQGEREEAEERLAAYEKKYRLLCAAAEQLKEADQALKDRYFKPVKDRFLHYTRIVEQAIGERVTLSGNFKLSFERHGKERSERHLSAGQRAICALCFRLALIENMYDGHTPFLVLDDPFMALDATHLARVKEVLAALSADTQILYFTCHESRAM